MKFKSWIKYLKYLFFIIIVAVIIRVLVFEIYQIPSGSMRQTLFDGDFVLLSKLQYGARLGFHKDRCGEIRTPALGKISHNDIVIFNFPEGDTVYVNCVDENFYMKTGKRKHEQALADTLSFGSLTYLPVKYRPPYVKRCIALPGDTFEMHDGLPYINRNIAVQPFAIVPRKVGKSITESEINKRRDPSKKINNPKYWQDAKAFRNIFPNNYLYRWSHSIFGPIIIPQKGVTVKLDYTNIWLYRRIIEAYEYHKLEINDDGIFINGKLANTYTFKMNYYFMLGDNRPNSIDSMFWGFVPEDHIIGKIIMVLFSYGEKENGEKGIRWNRIFKSIN